MTKKDKKTFNQTLAEWKLFIYNPTTGEFLGRTAKSWGERAAIGRPVPAAVRGGRRAGGRMGKKKREAVPRAGSPRSRPQRFSPRASGFLTRAVAERGPFISRGTGGPSLAAEDRGQPRPGRADLFLPAQSARAARAARPERRRKPGTPARSRAPSVRGAERPGLLCTEREGRERPWRRRRLRRAVRGSQTLPHAPGEEISTPAAIL